MCDIESNNTRFILAFKYGRINKLKKRTLFGRSKTDSFVNNYCYNIEKRYCIVVVKRNVGEKIGSRKIGLSFLFNEFEL